MRDKFYEEEAEKIVNQINVQEKMKKLIDKDKRLFEVNAPAIENMKHVNIVKNFVVFLEYGSPLVFAGLNDLGNIVVGYYVGYDGKLDVVRYYHVLVEPGQFLKYVSGEITLLDLFKMNQIFVLDFKDDENYIAYCVKIDDIPDKFLPTDKSYFPCKEIEE